MILVAVLTAGPCQATDTATREVGPSTVAMQLPPGFGEMQRPAVEFDHRLHTEALGPDSCETCHRINGDGTLLPGLKATLGIDDLDTFVDAVHDTCMDCHKQRSAEELATGPVTCGGCHVKRRPGASVRAVMAFDYSLHGRHAIAFEEKCESCHHVWNEATEKLTYEKGEEEGCSACHGAVDEENKLSLANASHQACISCHLRRARLGETSGPSLCVGCHDLSNRQSIEVLEEIPRLVRGQKDTQWISSEGSRSAAVAFNHLAHEGQTVGCSDCHHQSMRPCDECHTQMGSAEGNSVTTEQAYHLKSSSHSCVGCHETFISDRTACMGCHRAVATGSSERVCVRCHNGPQPGSPSMESAPVAADPGFEPLPALSDDFPETVVIDLMVDTYEASTLPHAKIVNAIAAGTAESVLANTFHGGSATLCSGCHHHTPIGVRPPPCRSCHSTMADATTDRPGLKVAYHRQCVGCHQDMKVDKVGCTDCHAKRAEEVES
jgi:hypothetical protein